MARGVTPSHVGLRHGPFLNRRDTGHVRLIAAAWQSEPIAFAARAKCCISVRGAFYRKPSTPWPTKRPRLAMTRSILRRSFTVALACLDSRRSGWNSLRDHEKYAEKCMAMALSSEQDVDKALWLSLAQSWVRLGEQVASVERQSGAAAPNL